MVNVAKKPITRRVAIAKGEVQMTAKTLELIKENKMKKGDVLGVAQIAGIQGAKRTAELIPFCHPIQMDHISVGFSFDDNLPGVQIESRAECDARTGVEMEALTAVSVAALTIYDMAKSADKTMRIGAIRLVKKTGGQSGDVSNE
jgi:cyclic pyranopterin phosphate synthase